MPKRILPVSGICTPHFSESMNKLVDGSVPGKCTPGGIHTPKSLTSSMDLELCASLKVGPQLFRGERKMNLSDKFEQLEIIGKGSFGEVRKVKDRASGKISVMKSMLKSQCQKSELIVDEIEILKQLVLFSATHIGSSPYRSIIRVLPG